MVGHHSRSKGTGRIHAGYRYSTPANTQPHVTRIPARPQSTSGSFPQLGLGHAPPQNPSYRGVLEASKEDTGKEAISKGLMVFHSAHAILEEFPEGVPAQGWQEEEKGGFSLQS